jgi:hypothetical protein
MSKKVFLFELLVILLIRKICDKLE